MTHVNLVKTATEPSADNDYVGVWHVRVELSDLIDYNIDELNDYCSEIITGSIIGLEDIQYSVVGEHSKGVLVAVTAALNDDDLL